MLAEYSNVVSKLSIVLGSQSPRRHQIFRENLGLQFNVIVSNFAEDIPKSSCNGPNEYVIKTCYMKACDIISKNFPNALPESTYPHLIITSDTIVVHNHDILEKPTSRENCRFILNKLSGQSHQVITAVTLAKLNVKNVDIIPNEDGKDNRIGSYSLKTFSESTLVEFIELSENAVNAYMDSGEPFDKAGGYGIQGLGSSFVKGIHGCFFNVMGFPVHRFCVEVIPLLIQLEKDGPFL